MNNACPNCGITGPNFSCPNHTYCWGTGNTQSPTIQPQVTWMPVSEQLNNSSLFAEIGRLNVLLNERDKEIERLKGLMPPDERGPGFVGQGSWSVFAEKVVAERDAALEKVAELTECLRWYVENDDTNEGGKWEESNAGWLEGKRRAMRALGMEEE